MLDLITQLINETTQIAKLVTKILKILSTNKKQNKNKTFINLLLQIINIAAKAKKFR